MLGKYSITGQRLRPTVISMWRFSSSNQSILRVALKRIVQRARGILVIIIINVLRRSHYVVKDWHSKCVLLYEVLDFLPVC